MTSISAGLALWYLADHADWLVPRVEYPLGLLISKPARLELLSHEEWILWNVDRYRRYSHSGQGSDVEREHTYTLGIFSLPLARTFAAGCPGCMHVIHVKGSHRVLWLPQTMP